MNPSLSKYCKKVTVDLTDYCDGDHHTVMVREPTTGEVKSFFKMENAASSLATGQGKENIDDFIDILVEICEILPQMIIDHDFFDGTNKLSSKEVAEFIASDFGMTSAVTMELMQNLPLVKGNAKK